MILTRPAPGRQMELPPVRGHLIWRGRPPGRMIDLSSMA